MLDTIKEKDRVRIAAKRNAIWSDDLIQEYYSSYFNNLTSKQLDKEFNKDITTLVRALSKLPEQERKIFIEALASVIEFYLENKVEKEIEFSLHKILKF